jgi:tryptophan synthase alpha chain
MSQRLNQLLLDKKQKKQKCLSVFVTAGFPNEQDTAVIIRELAAGGVDFVELGIPFSDPLADGPVIQSASDKALANGMTLAKTLEIAASVRQFSEIPLILMGYLNPVYQMGMIRFIQAAHAAGVDGLILPDWPIEESAAYAADLKKADLDLIHLIAPNTPPERIQYIDAVSSSFIYCVAYTGVTGRDNRPTLETLRFFEYLQRSLTHPWLIGFGVKNHDDFQTYTQYADGVIIGSAFIKMLDSTPVEARAAVCHNFAGRIRNSEKT